MDGNGRWAAARGLPRIEGHRAGAGAVRRTVQAAPEIGVRTLTLYAFSSDNWKRPAGEVQALMELLRLYLEQEVPKCLKDGVRLNVIGRRDRLSCDLRWAIGRAERATASCATLDLRIAVDYSSRDTILRAAARCAELEALSAETFSRLIAEADHSVVPAPPVDLLIRTSGEQRLSDFLLWECAYAEFYFTSRMWPDFSSEDLSIAVTEFRLRNRRFGRVGKAVQSLVPSVCAREAIPNLL